MGLIEQLARNRTASFGAFSSWKAGVVFWFVTLLVLRGVVGLGADAEAAFSGGGWPRALQAIGRWAAIAALPVLVFWGTLAARRIVGLDSPRSSDE